MNQGEDIAVVTAEQITQVSTALSVALIALSLAHRSDGLEGLGDLIVQFYAVGHDHEGPVPLQLAQHLLREKHHGEALAAALRLPEHAGAAVSSLARFEHRG